MNRSAISYLKGLAALAALATILASFAPVAVATPGEGIVGTVYATAGFVDRTDLKFKFAGQTREVIGVVRAEDTVIQQVIISPGGHTGWHSHPGPAVVLIKSGAMSFYDSEDPTCTARVYSAGDAFIDSGQGHVHIARNEGSVDLEVWVTYFDVPADGIFRIDAADPGNCIF